MVRVIDSAVLRNGCDLFKEHVVTALFHLLFAFGAGQYLRGRFHLGLSGSPFRTTL